VPQDERDETQESANEGSQGTINRAQPVRNGAKRVLPGGLFEAFV